jgi:hypothetical protein
LHEEMGSEGIASWLFAVKDINLPFGKGKYARSSKYVFPKKVGLVYRAPESAIPSLIIENAKNIQSYEFRKKWIKIFFNINLDAFADEEIKALASFVYWYKICLSRKPEFVLRLYNIVEDARVIAGLLNLNTDALKEQFVSLPVNANKRYLGHTFSKRSIDFNALLMRLPSTLKSDLEKLAQDIDVIVNAQSER